MNLVNAFVPQRRFLHLCCLLWFDSSVLRVEFTVQCRCLQIPLSCSIQKHQQNFHLETELDAKHLEICMGGTKSWNPESGIRNPETQTESWKRKRKRKRNTESNINDSKLKNFTLHNLSTIQREFVLVFLAVPLNIFLLGVLIRFAVVWVTALQGR